MTRRSLLTSLRMLMVLTILTGGIYPALITLIAQTSFPARASGSLLMDDSGMVVGSSLLGQDFGHDPRYFWSRPSATGYDTQPSGGSNLGLTSAVLQAAVTERTSSFREGNHLTESVSIPSEMVFASGSGLDPHISPGAARLQTDRVAAARGLPRDTVAALVEAYVEPPQMMFLGQHRVNVLQLNLALDDLQS